MTKITNLGTSAFYELQEATKKAKIYFDDFETAISKVFPKQLWEIVKIEFEKDLKEDEDTFICDIILMSEPDFINEEEMNFLLNEMSEYAEENGMEVGRPFWNCNDIDSRRNFINEKIKKYS